MRKLKLLPIVLILLLLTACGEDKENTTEESYGAQLIDRYEKSSETVDDYNRTNQNKFDDLNEIADE
ncbi:MAG: hypothetical protein J6L77_09365 [Coprococcus sp.]|nr:hypothetical protein [Coprococcus sp.]